MDKVIIIGAGVTGLALAQGLKKAGISYVIYERNESVKTRRNWTFGIHWGIDSLKELLPEDLFGGLEATQVDPHHPGADSWYQLPLHNGKTGELMKVLDSTKVYRLRRDKVRGWLATGLDVKWNKEIQDISYSVDGQSVTVSFVDGTQDIGAVVIGCDGAHSKVRELLVGKTNAQLDPVGDFATTMCYSQHTRTHALFLRSAPHHPINQVGVHPDGHTAFFSLHAAEDLTRPEDWIFFHYISYRATPQHHSLSTRDLIAHQKLLAESFADPWRSVYEWMDLDSKDAWFTRIQDWDPSLAEHCWDNQSGRVTLAGDAAHPMSFQRGQGLNNAVQDAADVCAAVKSFWGNRRVEQRAEAISAYEETMKERGGTEVRLSAQTTIMLHDFGKMAGSTLMRHGMQSSDTVEILSEQRAKVE